jgi:signal transduction histidine kinase
MFLARKAGEVADHPRAAAVLKETGVRLEEILSEIRRVVQTPEEPGAGTTLDVERALASEVERRRADTDTRLRFEAQPGVAGRLSPAQGLQAVWLVRNALTNCLRHARAREAGVRLHAANDRVCLEIHDDGDGFDPGAVAGRGGTGLPSMQQRAADMGGTLTVQSQPGRGTRVLVEFPPDGP